MVFEYSENNRIIAETEKIIHEKEKICDKFRSNKIFGRSFICLMSEKKFNRGKFGLKILLYIKKEVFKNSKREIGDLESFMRLSCIYHTQINFHEGVNNFVSLNIYYSVILKMRKC